MQVDMKDLVPFMQRPYVIDSLGAVAMHAPTACLVGGMVARLTAAQLHSRMYTQGEMGNVLYNLDFVISLPSDVNIQGLKMAFEIDYEEQPTEDSYYWHGWLRGRGKLPKIVAFPLRLACCPYVNIWARPDYPPHVTTEVEFIFHEKKHVVKYASPPDVLVDSIWVCCYENAQPNGMRARIRRTALAIWGIIDAKQKELAGEYWQELHEEATGLTLPEAIRLL